MKRSGLNMKRRKKPCPCGSARPYESCCGVYHKKVHLPPTPVALMRARFTAYAKGRASYIMETTDPDGPHFEENEGQWRTSILAFSRKTRFIGLEVLSTGVDDHHGWVHFRASLRQSGHDASFEEKSNFRKAGLHWLYVDGLLTPCGENE